MKKFMSFMLAFLAVLTLGATLHVSAATGDTYSLVKSQADLDGATEVILGGLNTKDVMGSKGNKIYNVAKVTNKNSTKENIVFEDGFVELTLGKGNTDGTYSFKDGQQYLAGSSTKNKLAFTDTINQDSSWEITINDKFEATITSKTTKNYKVLSYNGNKGQERFSVYKAVQAPTCIYVKDVVGTRYTTTFNFGGSSQANAEVLTLENKAVRFPTVNDWRGHKFLGWFDESGTEVKEITAATKDQTLTARWQELELYTINFDFGGSEQVADPITGYVDETTKLPKINDRVGYLTDGNWYDAAEGGSIVTSPLTITGNQTLYAHWIKRLEGSVTYFANGCNYAVVTGYENDSVATVANPKRDGYKFLGWFTELNSGKEVILANEKYTKENVTYYAKWEKLPESGNEIVLEASKFVGYNSKPQTASFSNVKFSYVDVMNQQKKIQLKNGSGEIHNVDPLPANIQSIKFQNMTNTVKVSFGTSALTAESNPVIINNNEIYNVNGDFKYLRIETNGVYVPCEKIIITLKGENVNTFANLQTQASLAISYNSKLEAKHVDLRFGGIVPTDVYKETQEYGVIVVPAGYDKTTLTYANLDDLKNNKGFALKAEVIAEVDGGYQFSWVIDNLDGHYGYKFDAYMYTVVNNELVLAKVKTHSIASVAETYKGMSSLKELHPVFDDIIAKANPSVNA